MRFTSDFFFFRKVSEIVLSYSRLLPSFMMWLTCTCGPLIIIVGIYVCMYDLKTTFYLFLSHTICHLGEFHKSFTQTHNVYVIRMPNVLRRTQVVVAVSFNHSKRQLHLLFRLLYYVPYDFSTIFFPS